MQLLACEHEQWNVPFSSPSASAFNANISKWNVASVASMLQMFYGATAFNQDIGSWNTATVANMAYMFYGATAFNQNIASWNTASLTDMASVRPLF